MWDISGKSVDQDRLGALAPREILHEFGGEPLTFTADDPDGGLLLVHSLCVFDATSRYLVSPIDARLLKEMKAGRLDIHSALRQPRCWIVDLVAADAEPTWRVQSIHLIDFDAVPKDHLPRPGTMISPDLDPLFRIRLVGPGVGPGKTKASDIRMAAQSAESGLRGLARIAFDEKTQVGQVRRDIRHYSDLPYLNAKAASFEILFGRPHDRLPGVDDEVFDEMASLLERGLNALRSDADELAPVEGLTADQSLQLFEAIKALTPPTRGDVVRVEVGGSLVDGLTGSKALTRLDRVRSVQRIKAVMKPVLTDPPFRVSGKIEQADQGKLGFTLRQLDPPGYSSLMEIPFWFKESLYDDVMEGFNSTEHVVIVGEKAGSRYEAIKIEPAGSASSE